MDPQRFDSLARSLGAAKTRRGVLGGLAALASGLLGARATDAQQVTQAYCGNVVCNGNGCACKPGCVCCVYSNGNSRCRPPQDCAGSGGTASVCAPPTTTTTAAPTCASGLAEGAQCGPGLVCVDGACAGNGACPNSNSCPFGAFDCGDAECSEFGSLCVCSAEGGRVCTGSVLCFDPEDPDAPATSDCATSADCPSGSICLLEACSNDDDTYAAKCMPVCGGIPT